VFGTSENVVTSLAAAPACLVIGFGTFPRRRQFPAEAALDGTHLRARRARSRVTDQVASVWALFGKLPLSTACLAT
jgi:hypothetical protein